MEISKNDRKKKRKLLWMQLEMIVVIPVFVILLRPENLLQTASVMCLAVGIIGKWLAIVGVGTLLGVGTTALLRFIWRDKELEILRVLMCLGAIPFLIWLLYGWAVIPALMARDEIPGGFAYLVMHFFFFFGCVMYLASKTKTTEGAEVASSSTV